MLHNIELELHTCVRWVLMYREGANDVMIWVWVYKGWKKGLLFLTNPPPHSTGQLPLQLHRLPLFRKVPVFTDWHHRTRHPVEAAAAEPHTFPAGCDRDVARCPQRKQLYPLDFLITRSTRAVDACWQHPVSQTLQSGPRSFVWYIISPLSSRAEAYYSIFCSLPRHCCLPQPHPPSHLKLGPLKCWVQSLTAVYAQTFMLYCGGEEIPLNLSLWGSLFRFFPCLMSAFFILLNKLHYFFHFILLLF